MSALENTDNRAAVYEKGRLYDISLNELLADPGQPRKVMEAHALEELAASIAKHGILEPVLFRQHEDGNLIIVAGERRIAAARKAGLTSVPALYVNGNSSEIALVENLLRQDLTAVEEAEALQRLLEQQKYTHEQLSGVIGKARTTISDILLINRLPQEVRDDCRGNRQVSKNVLIDISRKKQERAMITAYNSYKEKLRHAKRTRRKDVAEKDSSRLAVLGSAVRNTLMKLDECDMKDWEDHDKAAFCIVLASLRDRIDRVLSSAALSAPRKKNTGANSTDGRP